jgi:hypothetical protein
MSVELKKSVRVVRGANRRSKWAPAEGYRYDGEYFVEEVRGVSFLYIHRIFELCLGDMLA